MGRGLPQLSARLRYGLSLHQGQQVDPGPGITYSGLTPNDLSVWAVAYGLGPQWLGAQLSLQREAFTFSRESNRVTEGSLLRASLGLVARRQLGPVLGELSAGYGFAQLPVFSSSTSASPEFQRGARHAALFGGRLRFPLVQRVQGEVRAELPLALAAKEAEGRGASSSGFAAGAALLVPVKQMGRWEGAVVADYQYVHDVLTGDSGVRSNQSLQRLGVALELTWLDERSASVPSPLERPGSLSLQVVDAETKAPLAGAQVTLVVGGTAQTARTADAKGQVVEPELEPGEVVARVTAPDYEAAEGRITVAAGERATLEIQARKRPPAVGGLKVVVVDKRNNQPVPDAQVVVGAKQLKTNAAGQIQVGGLAAGPVSVKVSAPEFQSVEDAAVVVAGKESEMSVPLVPAKRVGYATISGRVRSTVQGRPLVATLVIPSAKVKTRTDAQGAFSVKLQPGTHHIIISAKGHLTQTKAVTVKDGEQAIFNVDLFPRTR
ncbi:MAG: collagen binding domain-containing protein [Hyalangium sp.]